MGRGVTVVTAAYNVGKLPSACRCVRRQTYQPIEHIIVNDGQDEIFGWYRNLVNSTEPDTYRAFPWIIHLDRRKGRHGLYGRNIGAMAAYHDRILFLDEDNRWESDDFVKLMVEAEEKTGKIPYCDLRLVGRNNKKWVKDRRTAFVKQNIDLGCLLYRKELFSKYGYFIDSKRFHTTFDWQLIKKIHEGEGGDDAFVKAETVLTFEHKLH